MRRHARSNRWRHRSSRAGAMRLCSVGAAGRQSPFRGNVAAEMNCAGPLIEARGTSTPTSCAAQRQNIPEGQGKVAVGGVGVIRQPPANSTGFFTSCSRRKDEVEDRCGTSIDRSVRVSASVSTPYASASAKCGGGLTLHRADRRHQRSRRAETRSGENRCRRTAEPNRPTSGEWPVAGSC